MSAAIFERKSGSGDRPIIPFRPATRRLRPALPLTGAVVVWTPQDVPFLGGVPIQIPIREHGDAGQTAANDDDPAAEPAGAVVQPAARATIPGRCRHAGAPLGW